MAAWIISALRLLGISLAAGAGFEGGQRLIPGAFGVEQGELGNIGSSGFVDGQFRVLPGGATRRRRRRRALTHQDKDDIAFIAATVGEPTARKFALLLASHHRGA